MRLWALLRSFGIATSVAVAAAACDSGPEVTPASTFPAEFEASRTLVGRVLAGTEPVPGSLVRVDVSPGFASDAELAARAPDDGLLTRTDTTNAAGAYRFAFAPISHDLTVRADGQLIVFRALSVRAFDVPLGIEATPSGYRASVVPTTNPPPRPGNAVAYFVSGADARSLGRAAEGAGTREVTFRGYESTITLHAVEYVATRGLAAAVAEGHIDVRVRDGAVITPSVPMTLLQTTLKVVFGATPPPGFALEPLEVEMDLGLRTSNEPVLRLAPGEPLDISIVSGARYTVHGRAVQAGGAVSDSGRFIFDSYQGKIPLLLPGPVSAETPIDDDAIATGMASNTVGPTTLDSGGVLAARLGKGVIEHVVAPERGDGPVLRVVTSSRATTLPDPTAFGLARPAGRHLWTLRHFPTLARVDSIGGEDGRITAASWTSAPRVIVLR